MSRLLYHSINVKSTKGVNPFGSNVLPDLNMFVIHSYQAFFKVQSIKFHKINFKVIFVV